MAKKDKWESHPVKPGWEYEPLAGDTIEKAANLTVHKANQEQQTITLVFNEKRVPVAPGSLVKDVVEAYGAIWKKEQAEWEATEAGKKHVASMAEAEERSAKLKAAGPVSFTIKAGQEDEWAKQVKMNDDDYSSCCIRYVARWAAAMELRLANGGEGLTIALIAKETSHDSDIEGITGFMYGASVSIMAKVWEHGEELRLWHNLDSGGEKQGEKANESGGVINPAILTIGGDKE